MYPFVSVLATIIGIILFVSASKIGTKKSMDIGIKVVGFLMIIGGLVMLYFVLSGKLVLPLSKDYQEENSSEVEIPVIPNEKEPDPEMLENTVNTDVSQGGTYVYDEESQISEIALSFSLKNITPTGATLVFEQHNADAPKGELMYGEDYVIEVLKNGEWEKAPIVVEGNYGFDAIAIMLPVGEISEREIDWKWLYGELEPGEYRIGKSVDDFIESGNYDEYMVYARFVLN